MISLTIPCTQEVYDAWTNEQLARAQDPSDEWHMADYMDSNMIFVTAVTLHIEHPDKRPLIEEHAPEVVELAGTELGLFMGCAELAKRIGMDAKEVQDKMMQLMTRKEG